MQMIINVPITKYLSVFLRVIPLVLFLISSLTAANAAVYTVTNANNDGAGSLRDAVNAANSTAENDTINFDIPDCPNGICTIVLSGGQLTVGAAGSLNIVNSSGADRLRIWTDSDNFPNYFRVLEISGGAVATIEGVTISKGIAFQSEGGGISNNGNLTLKNSVVNDNKTIGAADLGNGAGVYNSPSGVLTLLNMTVADNQNGGNFGGGGVYNNGGNVTITDSVIQNNTTGSNTSSGGGINNTGIISLTNSTVSGNTANTGGGINNTGTLSVTNSTISVNNAETGNGGGIYSSNAATVSNSTVSGNVAVFGAGINNAGNLKVSDSLISGNHDSENGYTFFAGGGLYNAEGGIATILNTTIANNETTINGAGIGNGGTLTLINSTVAHNTGRGFTGGAGIGSDRGTIRLRNTIAAENFGYNNEQSGICAFDSASVVSDGNNLVRDDVAYGCNPVSWQSSDILNQSPRFAPFGNYGGATRTLALTNNSLALNAGNNCVVTLNGCGDDNPAIPNDQRGAARVGNVDIGAFELNNTANGGNFRAVTIDGRMTVPFSYLLTANSGSFTYSVTAGSLPPGLTLSNTAGINRKSSKESNESPNAGAYSITGTPTLGGTFDYTITATDGTNSVSTNYRTTIIAAPTAAGVSVGGRALSASGFGIAAAHVTITDGAGNAQSTRTNSFGHYNFEVEAGETYILAISHRRFKFVQPTKVLPVFSDRDDINFIENP